MTAAELLAHLGAQLASRRERIATAALQGLLAQGTWSVDTAGRLAVEYADALIAELDKNDSADAREEG